MSFFTKISVDLAIKVADKRLTQDVSLSQKTALPVELMFMFCYVYVPVIFMYYQQIFGTAMETPVSAVIANLVMENDEQRALTSSSVNPPFWKRYVDDVAHVVNESAR